MKNQNFLLFVLFSHENMCDLRRSLLNERIQVQIKPHVSDWKFPLPCPVQRRVLA